MGDANRHRGVRIYGNEKDFGKVKKKKARNQEFPRERDPQTKSGVKR